MKVEFIKQLAIPAEIKEMYPLTGKKIGRAHV